METRQHGFTLWELLMTLLVAGILLGIGVPNVMEFQRNGAMTAAANDFVTGVLMARTEAVKRQAFVAICLSDNPTDAEPDLRTGRGSRLSRAGSSSGSTRTTTSTPMARAYLTDGSDGDAVVDVRGELVLMQSAWPGGTIQVSANCGHVSFAPTGFTRAVPGECVANPRSVLFCDDRGRRIAAGSLSSARVVRIDLPGRGQVLQELAAITAEIAGPLAGVAPTCP